MKVAGVPIYADAPPDESTVYVVSEGLGMNIGQVVAHLEYGQKCRRPGWGVGWFIALDQTDPAAKRTILMTVEPDQAPVAWVNSQDDLLTVDWELLE